MAQGFGVWLEESEDPLLGVGIFCWEGKPTVQIFENGFLYEGDQDLMILFEEMTGVEFLDLRSLMRAQKAPDQPVEFAVLTDTGRHALQVPLFLYATLSGVLNKIVKALPGSVSQTQIDKN